MIIILWVSSNGSSRRWALSFSSTNPSPSSQEQWCLYQVSLSHRSAIDYYCCSSVTIVVYGSAILINVSIGQTGKIDLKSYRAVVTAPPSMRLETEFLLDFLQPGFFPLFPRPRPSNRRRTCRRRSLKIFCRCLFDKSLAKQIVLLYDGKIWRYKLLILSVQAQLWALALKFKPRLVQALHFDSTYRSVNQNYPRINFGSAREPVWAFATWISS